jgi:hypothetical protein
MGFVLAFLFVVAAVVALTLYGGTPHGGPTATCGPVNFLGNRFTIGADCRYVSITELAIAGLCFFFALMSLLTARPHRR